MGFTPPNYLLAERMNHLLAKSRSVYEDEELETIRHVIDLDALRTEASLMEQNDLQKIKRLQFQSKTMQLLHPFLIDAFRRDLVRIETFKNAHRTIIEGPLRGLRFKHRLLRAGYWLMVVMTFLFSFRLYAGGLLLPAAVLFFAGWWLYERIVTKDVTKVILHDEGMYLDSTARGRICVRLNKKLSRLSVQEAATVGFRRVR